MASHKETGKQGEELAAKWLKENGYDLLHRNWRHSHYELDIVATKGKISPFFGNKNVECTNLWFSGGKCNEEKI